MRVMKTAQRSLITALKLKLRFNISSILTMLFLVTFSIFLSLGTNFSPINHNVLNHDCGIFSYVGYAMQKGRVLYSEVWENKGPLLYIIYYIGFFINGRYGVYLLELISIFISVLFGYKTIRLITNKKTYSILGIIYTFSVWGVSFENGTLSEDFALPLLLIGVYLFTKETLKNNQVKSWEIIVWGILTGLIAMLRLNILSIFLAFFIVIGIRLLFKKQIKEIFRWILGGTIGFIISILPVFIYLISDNALKDCMDSAYFGILNGFNSGTWINKIKTFIDMMIQFNISGISIFILGFMISAVLLLANKNIIDKRWITYIIATLLAITINCYANSVTGAYQMHYLLTFIPLLPMMIGMTIKIYDNIKIDYWKKSGILLVLILIISYPGYRVYVNFIKLNLVESSEFSINTQIQNYIYNKTKPDELVQLIGGSIESVSANYETKRLSASKYSYLPLWNSFTKERKGIMTNQLIEEVKEKFPKLIFICQYNNNANEFYELISDKGEWDEFLNENYIEDTQSIKYYIVYKRK